jgi:hypothetical protein
VPDSASVKPEIIRSMGLFGSIFCISRYRYKYSEWSGLEVNTENVAAYIGTVINAQKLDIYFTGFFLKRDSIYVIIAHINSGRGDTNEKSIDVCWRFH